MYDLDKDSCIRKYKVWAMKNQIPLTVTTKKRNKLYPEAKAHPFLNYLRAILAYFTIDDGLFHFKDDIWITSLVNFNLLNRSVNGLSKKLRW